MKKISEFSLLKSTPYLRNFPACGVRYRTDSDGYGLVLIHPNVTDEALIAEKHEAAKIKATKTIHEVRIPLQIAKAVGI